MKQLRIKIVVFILSIITDTNSRISTRDKRA